MIILLSGAVPWERAISLKSNFWNYSRVTDKARKVHIKILISSNFKEKHLWPEMVNFTNIGFAVNSHYGRNTTNANYQRGKLHWIWHKTRENKLKLFMQWRVIVFDNSCIENILCSKVPGFLSQEKNSDWSTLWS